MWKNTGKRILFLWKTGKGPPITHAPIVVQNIFEYFIEFSRLSKLFANFGHQSVHKAQQGTLKTELIYMCILINFQLDVTLGTINISHFHQN